jgi:gliding motility-associated-like protein
MRATGLVIIAVCLFFASESSAQERPFVSALSKYSALAGETISITGSNFVANSQVSFGAGVATFNFISSTQLEVTVPTNATYAPVTVTNLTTGRSGSSSRPFIVRFGGSDLNATDFDDGDDHFTIAETNQRLIWDVCLCDLDEDGDLDAATTHRETSGVQVHRNNSSLNTINFTENVTLAAPTDFSNIILCDDIDGDGKKDMIISSVLTGVFNIKYFQNNSSPGVINLTDVSSFSLPNNSGGANRSSLRIQLADIDGDGKKDLIAGTDTDIDNASDAKFFVYLNNSTVGSPSFNEGSPVEIDVPNGSKSALLDVGELNGDNLIDIAVTTNGTGSVYLYANKSLPGDVAFNEPVVLDAQASRDVIKLADFNNDGLADLVHSNNSNNNVVVYANTTNAGGTISFSQSTSIGINSAYGIDIGDLNGDGLTDLAISTLVNNGIKVLKNISSGSTIDFEDPVSLEVQRNPNTTQKAVRNLKIADLNGDAKPDLAFAFNSQTSQEGIFAVIANRNCLSPSIAPLPAEISFCYDLPFTLSAPKAFGVTYSWAATNAPGTNFVATGSDVEITIPSGSPASVGIELTITSTDGNCTDVVTQNYSSASSTNASAVPTIINSVGGTICGGDAFTLSSSVSGDSYLWTLPDGSTESTETIAVSSANLTNAGAYTLRVQEAGKCYSDPSDPLNVDIDVPPTLTIVNQDPSDNFCADVDDVTLEVSAFDGFDLEWFKDGATTSNTTNTIVATESGTFTVEVSSAAGCTTTTSSYEVFAIPAPNAMITADAEICVDIPLDFSSASSTGEDGFAMSYSWDFKDGNTATGLNVSNTFSTEGTYQVELTASYDDVDICEDIVTFSVTVTEVPIITITNTSGSDEKCPSDSVRLELPQNYQSYLWSTGDTGYFTYAKTTDDQSSMDISADVVTDVSCATTTQTITISNYANSGIKISATGFTDTDTVQLESGIKSVELTANTSGGTNYMWDTNDLTVLSQTTGEITEVFPKEAFTTVTATATDSNGCTESETIVIEKPGLQARKAFSPNGDGENDCWEIINSEDQAACTIYIFDTRGSLIYEAPSPFVDNCVWNGKVDGTGGDAVEGIYFFVLKCNEKSSGQTGSILLAR